MDHVSSKIKLCLIGFIIGILILILGGIKLTNKHLETLIKLEQKQTATETQKETTIPELIIEENNLAN